MTASERHTSETWSWRERAFDIIRTSQARLDLMKQELDKEKEVTKAQEEALEQAQQVIVMLTEQVAKLKKDVKHEKDLTVAHLFEISKLKDSVRGLEEENASLRKDKDALKRGMTHLKNQGKGKEEKSKEHKEGQKKNIAKGKKTGNKGGKGKK